MIRHRKNLRSLYSVDVRPKRDRVATEDTKIGINVVGIDHRSKIRPELVEAQGKVVKTKDKVSPKVRRAKLQKRSE